MISQKFEGMPAQTVKFEKMNADKNELLNEMNVKEDEEIRLSGNIAEPLLFKVSFSSENKQLILQLDPDDHAVITGSWPQFYDYKVEGSQGSTQIKTLLVQMREFIRDDNTMRTILVNLKPGPKKDSLMKEIKTQIDDKNKVFTAYVKQFADTTSLAPSAIFAAKLLNPEVESKYLVNFYDQLPKRFPTSTFVKENVDFVQTMLNTLKNQQDKSATTQPDSTKTTTLKSNYVRPTNAVLAPPIEVPGTDGNPIRLSDFKGKFVLLDFWASWCGPCRAENPNVVKAYALFKDKNFDIFGVSLDADKDDWLEAIAKDQLSWKHGSELQKWNSIAARDYQVQGIPANFLIDPDGYIIASNLHGPALIQKLEEVLQ